MNIQAFPSPAVEVHVPSLRELPPVARLSLRVGAEARPEVAEAIGLVLPARIGERTTSGTRSALCLGPDEWFLQTDETDGTAVRHVLADLSTRCPLSVVDVSDREVTIAIEGALACDLLATGCPLDLAAMPVGEGTRTVFDTVPVVLTREAGDRFHLAVWRSFMPHVRALLDIAGRELAVGL